MKKLTSEHASAILPTNLITEDNLTKFNDKYISSTKLARKVLYNATRILKHAGLLNEENNGQANFNALLAYKKLVLTHLAIPIIIRSELFSLENLQKNFNAITHSEHNILIKICKAFDNLHLYISLEENNAQLFLDALFTARIDAETVADALITIYTDKPDLLTKDYKQKIIDSIATSRKHAVTVAKAFCFLNTSLLEGGYSQELINIIASVGQDADNVASVFNYLEKTGLLTGDKGQKNIETLISSSFRKEKFAGLIKCIDQLVLSDQCNSNNLKLLTQDNLEKLFNFEADLKNLGFYLEELSNSNFNTITQDILNKLLDPSTNLKALRECVEYLYEINSALITHTNLNSLMNTDSNITQVVVAIYYLQNTDLLTGENAQENFNTIVNAGADAINVSIQLMSRETSQYMGFLRDTYQPVQSADDVKADAKHVQEFYTPTLQKSHFDVPELNDEISHGGPQLRRMAYLYKFLEDNGYIPQTHETINDAILGLVEYANSIKEENFSGSLPESSRRLFKLGVDRILRGNDLIIEGKNWSSRALLLGLYNLITHPPQILKEESKLEDLQKAFIVGVRQVIEAEEDDDRCLDPICLTAATRGFFANDARDNEVRNLEAVFPRCHARLREISVNLAGLLNYPNTLGEELIILLNKINEHEQKILTDKLNQAVIHEPSTISIINTGDDRVLYRTGIDTKILCNLLQIITEGFQLPEGINQEQADKIKDRLNSFKGTPSHHTP